MRIMKREDLGTSLASILTQKGVVQEAPRIEEIEARVERRESKKEPLTILYGETFDDKGNTLDSLKYYFFLSALAKVLENDDVEVEPTLLIADLGVYRNYPSQTDELRKYAEKRREFANKVKGIYGCTYDVKLFSEVSNTEEFKQKLEKIKQVGAVNRALMGMVRQTVPEDRREAEVARGYAYAFDEIAMILGHDMKIGPPREKLYDTTANSMVRYFGLDPLMGVYLTQSYPLGMAYGDYLSSVQIKKYGLTPYKAGSSDLTANRVIIGATKEERVKELIDGSQISASATKPNPVMDVAIIADLARQHLEKSFSQGSIGDIYSSYFSNSLQSKELKELAFRNLKEYVLKHLS